MEINTNNIGQYNIVDDSVPSFQKKENVDKEIEKPKDKQISNNLDKKIEVEYKDKAKENDSSNEEDVYKSLKDIQDSKKDIEIEKPEGSKLQFKLVEETDPITGVTKKEMVVFLLDSDTGKVIRRVPPEELKDSSVGSLIDEVS